jgi:hypothetical protein
MIRCALTLTSGGSHGLPPLAACCACCGSLGPTASCCSSVAHLGGGGLLLECLTGLLSCAAGFAGLLSRAADTSELVLAANACWPRLLAAAVGVPGSST